nr:MAG TPA: hypothetical protein [Caudoviricetes sp.]
MAIPDTDALPVHTTPELFAVCCTDEMVLAVIPIFRF